MTNGTHPCADGLTPACFKAYPDWAKMRFAQKLIHTLFPADITKRLPVIVQDAMTQMPPDWPPDQELPAALSLRPPTAIIIPPGGAMAPLYTAPFSPGPPVAPAARTTPGGKAPWLYDKFTTLNLAVWTEGNYGGGTNTISAGRLKQTAPLAGYAEIRKAVEATIPANFDWSFDLTYATDLGGTFYPYVETGAHSLELEFDPPTKVSILGDTDWHSFTIPTFLGTTDNWKLVYSAGKCALYRGSTIICTDITPPIYTGQKGLVNLGTTDGTIYIDELKIIEI